MLTVAYLAYGPRRLTATTVFSALTWMHVARTLSEPWRMVVYTDAPDLFRRHGVRCELLSIDDIDGAANPTGYGYRRKLLTIHSCAERYGGDILFLDGDTYLLGSPQPLVDALSAGRAVLHTVEETLAPGDELHRLLHEHDLRSPALRAVRERPPQRLWNSGVVGVPAAALDDIPAVIAACDELYPLCPRHTIEQVAWSIVLEQATELVPAEDVVMHYWWDWAREQVTQRVAQFLRANRGLAGEDLATAAFAARPEPNPSWRVPIELRARRLASAARVQARSLLSLAR